MKLKSFLSLGFGLIFLASSALAADNLTNTLQNGLFEEEANHNLAAAVRAYQAVIVRLDEDRKLAATAVFRLAECYRKLGQTNEANVQYQRVLRDFSDQTRLVELSRLVLDAANPSLAPAAAPGAAGSLDLVADGKVYHPITADEANQLRSLIAMTKDSPDLVNAFENGQPRLYSAALEGRLAVAEYLLDHESEAEKSVQILGKSWSPLQIAASRGHRAMVQLLLDHGFLVDGSSPGGAMTALEYAAQSGYLGVAEILVARGAKVNDPENSSLAPLLQAAERNQPAMAKFLIAQGADVNVSNRVGRTALHLAAGKGFLDLTRLLLDHQATVNARDSEGYTPLLLAARGDQPLTRVFAARGRGPNEAAAFNPWDARTRWYEYGHSAALTNIIALLVGKQADVNATNQQGQTALHWIALVNAPDTLQLLLANKAEVNAADESGATPLSYAVEAVEAGNVGILLEHGADAKLRYNSGGSPLSWLAGLGINSPSHQADQKIELLLTAHGAVIPGPQPFVPAANPEARKREDADFLKRYGIRRPESNTNAPTSSVAVVDVALEVVADGKVYHAATDTEAAEIRSMVALAKDAPDLVKSASANGPSRLYQAAMNGETALAEYLLAHGANVEEGDHFNGIPPIHAAARQGHKAVVELLLAHGAKVDAPDRREVTALHLAAEQGFTMVAETLLDHGADVNAKAQGATDHGGATPLLMAAGKGLKAMVDLLLTRSAKVDARESDGETALHMAARFGYIPVAESLLARGADINARDRGGATPLMLAVQLNQPATASFLISRNADVNTTSQSGRTALHLAVGAGFLESTKLLLDHQATVDPKDRDGNTPLILIASGDRPPGGFAGYGEGRRRAGGGGFGAFRGGRGMSRWNGSPTKVMALLVAHRADVNATNLFGQTALHWIARSDVPDATELLLAGKAATEARDIDGRTPLFNAIQSLRFVNVSLLLDRGADPNAKDGKGLTPTFQAAGEGFKENGFSLDDMETSQRIQALLVARGGLLPKTAKLNPFRWDGKLVVTVVGEVQKPGQVEFTSEKPMSVADAIVASGGFTKTANRRRIVIIRRDQKILFDYGEYIKSPGDHPVPPLEDGDVVSVPETFF